MSIGLYTVDGCFHATIADLSSYKRTDTVWLERHKMFTVWPYAENICSP